MTRLEMWLALNRLGQLMDDETFARCKTTLDDIENAVIKLYDKVDKLEADTDDGK